MKAAQFACPHVHLDAPATQPYHRLVTADLPAAIFFDLDDTILDDSANTDEHWRRAVETHTRDLAGLNLDALLEAIHSTRTWYWSDPARHQVGRLDLRAASTGIVAEALSRLGSPAPDLARRIGHLYRDMREQDRALFPGALEALERVRSLGIKMALLTNGDAIGQRAKITQFDLARHFDYICVEGEFGCGKPDERVYRGALEALRAEPATTWMVGDNLEWDVAAPMRLGLTGIWLDRFATGLPDNAPVTPHRIVLTITELIQD
jgi:putative hydrolase of the HAD superfamily